MNNTKPTLEWDDKAAKAFARHDIDVERGFEQDEPNVDIKTIEELLGHD